MLNDLTSKLDSVLKKLKGEGRITEKNVSETMRSIRRVLLEADVNYKVAKEFIQNVQEKSLGQEVLKSITPAQLIVKIINDELTSLLGEPFKDIEIKQGSTTVIMIVGLQGSGKTTFTAKLANYFKKKNKKPFLASVDVYRPAARKQLEVLAKSLSVPVLAQQENDPVTIAGKALEETKANSGDVLILDTAGRLHIDDEMMKEVSSLKEAIDPDEILFIADGMTGQDAVNTASVFLETLDFTGVVLTKLDGDAKGGAALSIRKVTGKPIRFISVGEKINELEPFHPDRMASRILGMGDVVSLVEKAQESIDVEKAAELEEKLKRSEFNFVDFKDQLAQLKNMGPLENLLDFIPGGKKLAAGGLNMDSDAVKRTEAIIDSMTEKERFAPKIINGSRRLRIARGSGTTVQDVNRLIKQFSQMQKMMKTMSRKSFGKNKMSLF